MQKWVSVWGNAVSIAENRPERYAKDITLRYPIASPFAGSAVRLTFDNYCGTEPVTLEKVTIFCGGAFHPVTFGGERRVTLPAEGNAISDALETPFRPSREPRSIDGYGLDDIHAARLLVERPVVGDAADRITSETVEFLREAVRAQRASIGDPVRFLISDREFHTAIYRACGNPVLADFVVDLFGTMVEFRRRAVAEAGAIEASIADHERIVAAFESRDRPRAVAAMEEHLERIYRTTQIAIAKTGRPAGEGEP